MHVPPALLTLGWLCLGSLVVSWAVLGPHLQACQWGKGSRKDHSAQVDGTGLWIENKGYDKIPNLSTVNFPAFYRAVS